MKTLLLLVVLLWSWGALAKPPTKQADHLSQQASRLLDQSQLEADPTKARDLLRDACHTWKAAYDLGKQIDVQLSLGLCYLALKEDSLALGELRVFLAQAPAKHPGRNMARESLAVAEKRDAEAKEDARRKEAATRPALVVVSNPLELKEVAIKEVTLKKEKHPWRKPLAITGGALGGAGVIAAFVVRGLVQNQQEDLPEINSLGKEP